MAGILFICERSGGGVASIPLRQIKNAFRLKLIHGGRVEEHDLKGHSASTVVPGRPDGDPVITIQIEEPGQPVRDYPLANWPNAVAVTISDTLFWLEGDGRWRLNPDEKAIAARSLVEARYCPDGYDLPNCWASHNLGPGSGL
jgi:hypothetical protein